MAPTGSLSWQQHLAVGGVARGVSVATLFPIDSIKTRMQVGQKITFSLSDLGQVPFRSCDVILLTFVVWLRGNHRWRSNSRVLLALTVLVLSLSLTAVRPGSTSEGFDRQFWGRYPTAC